MQEMYVHLPTPQRVQQFVEALTPLEGDFELLSGRYILDARSLMGIFSLDLSRPLRLRVYNDTPEALRVLQPFAATGKEEEARHE